MEYNKLAKELLEELYHTPDDLRASFLADQLLKAYTEGLEIGWAIEQDGEYK